MRTLEPDCYLCGKPARGRVPVGTLAPAHTCRQCSEEHCALEQYYRVEWRVAEEQGQHDWLLQHLISQTS